MSDHGGEFVSDVIIRLNEIIKMRHHVISPYSPHVGGQIVRVHRTRGSYLKIYYYNTLTEWINFIPSLRLALNTRIHNSTRMSPYFMACMEHPSFPWPQDMHLSYSESDVMSEARPLNHARGLILSESDGARAASKGAYDSKTKTQRFEPGEKVILHYPSPPEGTNRKLYPPWKGAYKVIHKDDDLIYKLRKRGGRMETAHINQIRDNLPPPIDRYTSANQNLAIATNRQKPRNLTKGENSSKDTKFTDEFRAIFGPN